MSRRKTGVIFCVIAAFLLAAWYLTAAIYLSGTVENRCSDDFIWAYENIGPVLPIFSAIAFIGGIIYLIIAEKNKE